MSIYADLPRDAQAAVVLKKLSPISAERLSALETQFGTMPADYVAFLREIGAGPFGNDQYMLYDGLLTPDEIFSEIPAEVSGLLLFGDDMQGTLQALDPQSRSVVEIDSVDMTVLRIAPSFEAFIRKTIDQLL